MSILFDCTRHVQRTRCGVSGCGVCSFETCVPLPSFCRLSMLSTTAECCQQEIKPPSPTHLTYMTCKHSAASFDCKPLLLQRRLFTRLVAAPLQLCLLFYRTYCCSALPAPCPSLFCDSLGLVLRAMAIVSPMFDPDDHFGPRFV
jgi:hypothetical protein